MSIIRVRVETQEGVQRRGAQQADAAGAGWEQQNDAVQGRTVQCT